ncbi:MAG: hypothetical protein GY854_11740 [Deltaproteobacteria bacterium]|nr:hypothetical protein [Deltaproteobacteria bacterium]
MFPGLGRRIGRLVTGLTGGLVRGTAREVFASVFCGTCRTPRETVLVGLVLVGLVLGGLALIGLGRELKREATGDAMGLESLEPFPRPLSARRRAGLVVCFTFALGTGCPILLTTFRRAGPWWQAGPARSWHRLG